MEPQKHGTQMWADAPSETAIATKSAADAASAFNAFAAGLVELEGRLAGLMGDGKGTSSIEQEIRRVSKEEVAEKSKPLEAEIASLKTEVGQLRQTIAPLSGLAATVQGLLNQISINNSADSPAITRRANFLDVTRG